LGITVLIVCIKHVISDNTYMHLLQITVINFRIAVKEPGL